MSAKPASRNEPSAILRRNIGKLSTTALARMEQEEDWFPLLSAQERSWIGMVVQAGIRGFAQWLEDHGTETTWSSEAGTVVASDVFGAAPSAFAGVISLEQTVELIRLTIDVVEENLNELFGDELARDVHNAVLRFGREFAFATAEVYARAAEARGAWDARLEALVVDTVLRDEPDENVLSQANALGWGDRGDVLVVFGPTPADRRFAETFDEVRRTARAADMDALCATHGDRVVVVLGGVSNARTATTAIEKFFGPGPVVFGPPSTDLGGAHRAAQAAASAFRAAVAWPGAPRPVSSDDLLPERALSGEEAARDQLVAEIHRPLMEASGTLIETLDAYFAHGTSVEATARSLFVHPNTVRYRLRQTAELTGMSPNQPRDAYAIRIAITLGRLTRP